MNFSKPLLSLLLAFLLVGFPLGAGADDASPSGSPLLADWMNHQKARRTYYLYTPPSYRPEQPMPLVLAFHGYLGSARRMMKMTDFNALAEQEGFLVVYADAHGDRWNTRTGGRDETDVDVTFVRALVRRIQSQRNVDTRRIYATGFSNGGFFSHRLACEAGDLIAAIATVASTIGEPLTRTCAPGRPMPVLMINGTDDPVVTWRGEFRKVKLAFRDSDITSVPGMVEFWRRKNQCAMPPLSLSSGDVRFTLFQDCLPPAEVRQIVIQRGGHTWPGKPLDWAMRLLLGRSTQDLSASLAIWEFFERHPMPDEPEPLALEPLASTP